MTNYMAISEVGHGLVRLLRENMVPDVILNAEYIGLCSPDDKGDLQLGINLYDIKESEEVRDSGRVHINARSQKFPSTYLSLYYMITAYSNGDIKFRASEEHKILGRVIQTLRDYARMDSKTYLTANQADNTTLLIEMLPLSYEDKLKIWTTPNKANKLSLFYRVTPVEIESDKTKEVQRVVDMDLTIKEQN